MIAFGCALTEPETYDRCAAPGIRLAAEPDSEVLAYASVGSIFRSYNMLLDLAAEREDLEALVLVHQDAEIVDSAFVPKLREALRNPEVALVGCAGSVGSKSIAWWEGFVTWASFSHRYEEFGGGEFPALTWAQEDIPQYAELGEVDAIDGFCMALSPWTVRNLRFDESLGTFHGYDFDFCMQVRSAGRKIAVADWKVVHHHDLELIRNEEAWIDAHVKLSEKWHDRMPHVGSPSDDWKARARRAEAEASATRTRAATEKLLREAMQREIWRIEESASWRMTKPLRWAKSLVSRNGSNGSRGH
jgi:GT2 family glycosyltransferase